MLTIKIEDCSYSALEDFFIKAQELYLTGDYSVEGITRAIFGDDVAEDWPYGLNASDPCPELRFIQESIDAHHGYLETAA